MEVSVIAAMSAKAFKIQFKHTLKMFVKTLQTEIKEWLFANNFAHLPRNPVCFVGGFFCSKIDFRLISRPIYHAELLRLHCFRWNIVQVFHLLFSRVSYKLNVSPFGCILFDALFLCAASFRIELQRR